MVHIVVVSRHNLIRRLLSDCFAAQKDFAVAAELERTEDAPGVCETLRPNLFLFDVALDNVRSALSSSAAIKKSSPSVKITFLTGLSDSSLIADAREGGVDSFLFYTCVQEGLVTCARGTASGYQIYPNEEMLRQIDPFAGVFTRREIKLLCMLCESKSREEIGAVLALSPSSIKGCVSSILNKTGYGNISQLISYMISHGCLAPR